jgi:hypothetical protein
MTEELPKLPPVEMQRKKFMEGVSERRRTFLGDVEKITTQQSSFFSVGTIKRLWSCVSSIFTSPSYIEEPDTERKWETHVAAEHMAEGIYSCNNFARALGHSVKQLEKMGLINQAKSLQYATDVLFMEEKKPIQEVSICVQKDVQKLSEGESLVIPVLLHPPHATLLEIRCTSALPGVGKKFSVTFHNSGDGLEYHHSRTIDGTIKYQTGYEILNVSEESLCGEQSTFFQQLFTIDSSEKFYTKILPILDGYLSPPNIENRNLWSFGQIGASCTASCVISWLRSHLSPEESKAFKDEARMGLFLKIVREIQKGVASTEAVNIALEIAKKLQRRIYSPKHKQLLDSGQTLEEKILAIRPQLASKKGRALSNLDDLLQVFEDLETRSTLPELINKFSKVSSRLQGGKKHLSQKEVEYLEHIVYKVKTSSALSFPLMKEQIYLHYKISELLNELLMSNNIRIPTLFRERHELLSQKVEVIEKKMQYHSKYSEKGIEFQINQFLLMDHKKRMQELKKIKDSNSAFKVAEALISDDKESSEATFYALIANPNIEYDMLRKEMSRFSHGDSQKISDAMKERFPEIHALVSQLDAARAQLIALNAAVPLYMKKEYKSLNAIQRSLDLLLQESHIQLEDVQKKVFDFQTRIKEFERRVLETPQTRYRSRDPDLKMPLSRRITRPGI